MSIVTLEEAKLHLRVDHDAEDALIQMYIEAAEDLIKKRCGEFSGDEFPSALKAGALLLIGDMYENREVTIVASKQSVSKTLDTLMSPHELVAI